MEIIRNIHFVRHSGDMPIQLDSKIEEKNMTSSFSIIKLMHLDFAQIIFDS